MAIINSAGIGKSRKSQGNLTYKYVRGRTIASSRIIENKSNTPKQDIARQKFAALSGFVVRQAAYIDVAFDKSRYGSSRNSFMMVNKSMLSELAYLKSYIEGTTSLFDMFGVWFGNPAPSPYKYLSYGSAPVLVSGNIVAQKQYYSKIVMDCGAGVPLADLAFGSFHVGQTNITLKTPLSFDDAGGRTNAVTVGAVKYTLTYTDDTNTIVSSISCAPTNLDSEYSIPIVQVRGKNAKVDMPIFGVTGE